MLLKIEAVQNVKMVSTDKEFAREVETASVVDALDFTAEFNAAKEKALAAMKERYPSETSFRLHICKNDEQQPCVIETIEV